tara:strand:- start:15 stop:293 length:279 start_codon:yes stop_codon:yes gene_type:complete
MNNKEIENLKNRINKLTQEERKRENRQEDKKGMSFGFRIGVELVAAISVGVIIGIFVDKYLGIQPFGLIIFFILGSLAGFLNIYRVMRRIEK